MALEGTVEVEDAQKTVIQPVEPQTEKILKTTALEEGKPLGLNRQQEVEELLALHAPEGRKKTLRPLEETLSLMLTAEPDRIKRYLENPKIMSLRTYPVLSEKISQAREWVRRAAEENRPELYDQLIQNLQSFSLEHLDPFNRFKPHIQFFIGAFYHYLGKDREALDSFARILQYPDSQWQAMARLARGILYEESLADPVGAREEYTAVLRLAPDSLEAEDARHRLSYIRFYISLCFR